eukprot:2401394-Rhodomonas_salina.2
MTGATPVLTPMEANTHLTGSDCQPPHLINKQFQCEYQRIIGSLCYMCTFTRQDLEHSVNQC